MGEFADDAVDQTLSRDMADLDGPDFDGDGHSLFQGRSAWRGRIWPTHSERVRLRKLAQAATLKRIAELAAKYGLRPQR